MYAIRQHAFGPAENLLFEEVDDPQPGAGQVRITVAAAGVHLLDTFLREGKEGGPFPLPELPMTPGREVAGVVTALGEGADPGWLGKRVVAHLGQASGGYAELAVANEASLHAVPDEMSDDVAVAMIGTGRTAMGILSVAQLSADDAVLVTAAAGGLGALLVQEARAVGATVLGLAGGGAKVDLVRELGADFAVDYTEPGWADRVREWLGDRELTVVLDGVGGDNGRAALELLSPGGRIILFGWSSGEPTKIDTSDLYSRGVTASAALGPRIMKIGIRVLEERSLAAATSGRLTPLVTSTFPLKDADQAHSALENRATVGKVVLKP